MYYIALYWYIGQSGGGFVKEKVELCLHWLNEMDLIWRETSKGATATLCRL